MEYQQIYNDKISNSNFIPYKKYTSYNNLIDITQPNNSSQTTKTTKTNPDLNININSDTNTTQDLNSNLNQISELKHKIQELEGKIGFYNKFCSDDEHDIQLKLENLVSDIDLIIKQINISVVSSAQITPKSKKIFEFDC